MGPVACLRERGNLFERFALMLVGTSWSSTVPQLGIRNEGAGVSMRQPSAESPRAHGSR